MSLRRRIAALAAAALFAKCAVGCARRRYVRRVCGCCRRPAARAFLGKQEAEALRVFQDEINRAGGINGRQLRIVISDDQTNPQLAVQLMTGVLENHPAIVLDGGPRPRVAPPRR